MPWSVLDGTYKLFCQFIWVLWHQDSVTKWTSLKWFYLPLIFFFILHLSVVRLVSAICLLFGRHRLLLRSSSSHRYAWTDIYCAQAEASSSSGIQVESQIYYPFPGGVCFKMEMNLGVQDVQHINNTCLPLTTAIKQFFSLNKTSGECNICIRITYSLKYLFIRQTYFLSHLPIYVIAVSGFFFKSVY